MVNPKLTWRIIALTIIFSTLVVSPLFAEELSERAENAEYLSCCWEDSCAEGWGRGRYYRSYDFQTTETLNGEVVSLENLPSGKGFQGTHLMVKTNQEIIEVRVAPSWYLAAQDFDLKSQDKIIVIGSRIDIDGQEAIVAREIIKGDRTLVLRDLDGIPLWRRGRVPTMND